MRCFRSSVAAPRPAVHGWGSSHPVTSTAMGGPSSKSWHSFQRGYQGEPLPRADPISRFGIAFRVKETLSGDHVASDRCLSFG